MRWPPVAFVLLLAGCDVAADNLAERSAGNLALEPLANEPAPLPENRAAAATCGPGAVVREAYPCGGACLQTPGFPAPMNCIRSMRTCYRTRPAPPCPDPAPAGGGADARRPD